MAREIVTSGNRQEYMENKLSGEPKEEDKIVATMPTVSKKSIDIGEGRYVHKHGRDTNGNHSVWVSQGAGTPQKIQSVQNLPTVHSTRPELTQAGVDEIHNYADKFFKKSKDDQFDRVKNHPKYEKLKTALGKKGATDALLKELNDAQ